MMNESNMKDIAIAMDKYIEYPKVGSYIFIELTRDKVEETDTLDFNRSSKTNTGYAATAKPGLLFFKETGNFPTINYAYCRTEYATTVLLKDLVNDLSNFKDYNLNEMKFLLDNVKEIKLVEPANILAKWNVSLN